MRRSLATWVLVAAAAALICLPSGCIGSRLGRKSSGSGWSMLGWGKKKSTTELAQNKPTPPASNVAPGAGLAGGPSNSSTQPFPAQPTGIPAAYASTGASPYGSTSGNNYVATSGGAAPQRGFYPDEYQGGDTASGSQNGNEYSNPSGGYGSYNDTADAYGGGNQNSYGGAQQGQGYEQVADQRGSYGGGASGGSGYGDQYGGDSRYVSPASGEQYDSRNPAPSQYNDGYGSQYQGTPTSGGYGGSQYSGGYAQTPTQGGSYGGAPVESTSTARQWLPGSTKPYTQQPLNPPTNSGYGGQY